MTAPQVAVGLADKGVDFGPLAETLARVVILVVTPARKLDLELAIEEDIAQAFASERALRQALAATTWTEFLAALRTSEDNEALKPSESAV